MHEECCAKRRGREEKDDEQDGQPEHNGQSGVVMLLQYISTSFIGHQQPHHTRSQIKPSQDLVDMKPSAV